MREWVVRRASSIEDLLRDPVGAYFVGHSFMQWFLPRIAGTFGFGRMHVNDEPAVRTLLVSPVLESGYDLLCDLSAVEVFDERLLEVATAFFMRRSSSRVRRVRARSPSPPPSIKCASCAGCRAICGASAASSSRR